MSLTVILARDHLTWKHPNIILSGQINLLINGWAERLLSSDRFGLCLLVRSGSGPAWRVPAAPGLPAVSSCQHIRRVLFEAGSRRRTSQISLLPEPSFFSPSRCASQIASQGSGGRWNSPTNRWRTTADSLAV